MRCYFTFVQQVLSDLVGGLNGIGGWQCPPDPAMDARPNTPLALCRLPAAGTCNKRETYQGQMEPVLVLENLM